MSVSKRMNKFVGMHARAVARTVILFYVIWFVSGMYLVDVLDPYLFIGLWMPVGALGAFICYRW